MLTMLKSIKENMSAIDIAIVKLYNYKTNLIFTKSEKDLLFKWSVPQNSSTYLQTRYRVKSMLH